MEPQTVAARIAALRMITPTTMELQLTPSAPFGFEAGQYVELCFPSPIETSEPLPFWPMALASAPHEEELTFCIRQREGSSLLPYLKGLQAGSEQELQVRGPFGTFGYHSAGPRKVGLIATGTGIAPLRAILRSQAYQQHSPETVMLFGAMTPDELPYADELQAIPSLTLIPVLSHADESWQGERGWVTDLMDGPNAPFVWEQTDFYLCGQPEMQAAARTILHAKGVTEDAIYSA